MKIKVKWENSGSSWFLVTETGFQVSCIRKNIFNETLTTNPDNVYEPGNPIKYVKEQVELALGCIT